MGRGKAYQKTRFNKSLGMLTELVQQLALKEDEIKVKKEEIERLVALLCEKVAVATELELIIARAKELHYLKDLTATLDCEIKGQNLIIDSKRKMIFRKQQKVSGSTTENINDSYLYKESQYGFKLTNTVSRKRKKNPTEPTLSQDIKRHRRSETVAVGMMIHGATQHMQPALNGLIDSVVASFPSKKVIPLLLNSKLSCKISNVAKQWAAKYEQSDENILRSINVFLQ